MTKGLLRWLVLLVAFWVGGPVAGLLLGAMRAPDGGPDISVFISQSPAMSIARTLAALVIAAAMGIIGARFVSVRTGLFASGLVMSWGAWAAGTVSGILRSSQSPGSFRMLTLEGAVLGAVLIGLAWAVVRASRRADPAGAARASRGEGAGALAAALGVGALSAWAFAQSDSPGQALAAAGAAGAFGTFAASLIDHRAGLFRFIVVLAALAIVGPASAVILHGDSVIRHFYDGSVFPLARITPLHWIAGLLLGVPMGSSWAAGMIKKEA